MWSHSRYAFRIGRQNRRRSSGRASDQEPALWPALPSLPELRHQLSRARTPTVKSLLSEKDVSDGVKDLAQRITADHGDRPLTIIGIMTGSIVLLADVIRQLEMPLRVGVVQTSSYRGGTERGELTINAELMPDIRQQDVLIIDDIFDTGHTLKRVVALMNELEPTSIRSAVLLRKEGRAEVAMVPDYVVFEIPDEFVVGYGLDYQDAYRNLPYVASLEPADLESH